MRIRAKRVYEEMARRDGYRVLVDRLWPRGLSKQAARLDAWEKEVTPSSALRVWYHKGGQKRFAEFSKRYMQELRESGALTDFRKALRGKKVVTLLTAAKDLKQSHVFVLLKVLRG